MLFNVGEYLMLTILYSLIVFTMVEALLRLWLIREPTLVLRFKLLVLALPPFCAGTITLLFRDIGSVLTAHNLVLFESEKWFHLIGDDQTTSWLLFFIVSVGGGTMFFSQTIMPTWRQYCRGKQQTLDAKYSPKLNKALRSLSHLSPHLPPVLVLKEHQPLAYVCGLRHLTVFLSTGLIEMLDEEELAAVLAHELAHIRKGDMWVTWIIFVLRGVMFYNPIATIAFNQISLQMEKACDEQVVLLTKKRLAYGSALLKVYRATAPSLTNLDERDLQSKVSFRLAAWEVQARRTFTEDRVKRILDMTPAVGTTCPYLRLGLLLGSAATLMILVT